MSKYVNGKEYEIFVDGFGEMMATYHEAEDVFVTIEHGGCTFTAADLERGMNGVMMPESRMTSTEINLSWFGSTVYDVYGEQGVKIPSQYRIVSFVPPKPHQKFVSVIGHTGENGLIRAIHTATAHFGELSPRLIVEEIEPCELCGELETVEMTEIKKTERARTYSLMMLCPACIEKNRSLVK